MEMAAAAVWKIWIIFSIFAQETQYAQLRMHIYHRGIRARVMCIVDILGV